MEIHLRVIGSLLILLSLIHVFFPKYFNWKEDLRPLSLINRQMMQVHAFFIALFIFGIGWYCLFFTVDMVHTPLGRSICFGLAVFWAVRLIFQLFVYSPKLWKGKSKETAIHIFFTSLWCYCIFIFGLIYFANQLN